MTDERTNGLTGFEGGAIGPVGPQCNPGPPGTPGPPGPKTVPLDDATIGLLADFARQAAKLEGLLEGQRNGALSLFARQRRLEGNWQVTADGRYLEQIPAAPAP